LDFVVNFSLKSLDASLLALLKRFYLKKIGIGSSLMWGVFSVDSLFLAVAVVYFWKFLGTLFRTVLNIFFSELRVLYYRYEDI